MFQGIMVPLDGSRYSTRALPFAIEVAKRFKARIVLLQVLMPTMPVYPVASTGLADSSVAELTIQEAKRQDKRNITRAKRYLSNKNKTITSQGLEGRYQVVMGDPADSIMKICRKEHIDLVVMTTHGKSGLKRAIMGSVADKVVRESGVPVLAIRPKRRKRK